MNQEEEVAYIRLRLRRIMFSSRIYNCTISCIKQLLLNKMPQTAVNARHSVQLVSPAVVGGCFQMRLYLRHGSQTGISFSALPDDVKV